MAFYTAGNAPRGNAAPGQAAYLGPQAGTAARLREAAGADYRRALSQSGRA
jgi:hypothetical protein